MHRTKEHANLEWGMGSKEIMTLVSSVVFSSNALFISSQARSVHALLKYGVVSWIDYVWRHLENWDLSDGVGKMQPLFP